MNKIKQLDPWERSRIKQQAWNDLPIDQNTLYAFGVKEYKRLCPSSCKNQHIKCNECFNFDKFQYFKDSKGDVIE